MIANYELCPGSTLDGVADSAIAAVEWIFHNITEYGGDSMRIGLSGHSAGAHLCAEILAVDWRERDIDPSFVAGAVLISGIFDPAPAIRTTVNAQLNLTPEMAARHDVERRPPQLQCPTWIYVGGLEPWHWIDLSFRYSHHLRRQSRDPDVHVLPGWGHFDIINHYADPESPIFAAALAATSGHYDRPTGRARV